MASQDYHSNYYAAFLIDPDGHNIEAVCLTSNSVYRSYACSLMRTRSDDSALIFIYTQFSVKIQSL